MSNIFNPPMESQSFFTAQQFNVNTSHPIIPSSQEYMYYNKYVSIHSEDRDLLKYPNSSEFEIELPEDYLNVASLRLVNWTFPANYNTFSAGNGNVIFAFSITNPYNPAAFGLSDHLNYCIYEALYLTQDQVYLFTIEEGFYNPLQMATELTNKFNAVVSKRIEQYFKNKGWNDELQAFVAGGGYTRFVIVYNSVSLKLWFGNTADGFTLINEVGVYTNTMLENMCSNDRNHVPDSSNWGLPSFVGLPRCNTNSVNSNSMANVGDFQTVNGVTVPRFYYGDVVPGDNGYWLLPNLDLSGSEVHWVEAVYKINLMGDAYLYMELEGQNCIDETQPYNISKFTLTTNQTNGIVNSSFAKLGVPTTPLSQWFDRDAVPYKFYYPPAERIRKLKIRIRYHNGRLANFGVFNYSFMLQFTLMSPQILRNSTSVMYPPNIR
ncbi:MAG: hypothetical protein ACOVRN_08805 [Flavobacterium sp.]